MVGIYDGATGAIRSAGWRRRDGDGCGLHSTMAVDRPAPGSPCDSRRFRSGREVPVTPTPRPTKPVRVSACYPHACGEDGVHAAASSLLALLPPRV